MTWNVSAAAVRRPLPVLVLSAVLLVLGVSSFHLIPITRSPNIDVPIVSVAIAESGAAPGEIETQVTRRVEDAVTGITGVKHVSSTVGDGASLTVVEFGLEANEDRALNDVKDAVSRVRDEFPAGIDEPVISRVDVVGTPIQTFAASAPGMTELELSRFVDDDVIRRLHALGGIADIRRVGGAEREIHVTLDADRLAALGITAPEVSRQVASTNIDLPGGRAELGGEQQTIRVLAGANTLARLAALSIVLPSGREARLSDLGMVTDGIREPHVFARLDGGRPVVGFAIERARGASDVSVAAGVQGVLDAIRVAHPGVSFSLIDDEVHGTDVRFIAAMRALVEGAVLVMAVVLVFLRDRRATLVASAALPLSVVPTCLAIHLLGFSFNFVSLLAITLASGILVDDAVVEIENIIRHMRMGKTARQATLDATAEIGTTVAAITLTIVAIFAPVSFMTGVAGQYFRQFGLTIAVAVLASLLVARLVTPLMAASMLRAPALHAPPPAALPGAGGLARAYGRVLRATLARPYATMVAGFVLFAAFLACTMMMPSDFIPASDEARSVLAIELPPGATLEDTLRKTDRIARDFMRHTPEITSIFTDGGETATGGRDVRLATMTIRYTPRAQRSLSQKTLETSLSALLAKIPDVRGWYMGPGGQRALEIDLMSHAEAPLIRAAGSLEGEMRRDGAFANVAASSGLASPELAVVPRADLAARLGVTVNDIADALRIATIGDVAARLPQFRAGDRMVPVRVEMRRDLRRDAAALGALTVPGTGGAAIPLFAVADLRYREGTSSIERYDGERRITVAADLAPGVPLGTAIARMMALPAARHLPAGVRIQNAGDAEVMGEVFSGLAMAMGTGLLLVFALLVLLFGDVFQPVTILLSLPLSLGGVILGLLMTGRPLSMPVVIGLLMLMGIVAKNAIMIVDFANRARRGGAARNQALVEAGAKRARPIVMTTVAMVAGMLPTAFSMGDGGEFRSPLAIAVIGGLIMSTALSLVFVPSFYLVMDDLHAWVARRARSTGTRAPVTLGDALSPEPSGAD